MVKVFFQENPGGIINLPICSQQKTPISAIKIIDTLGSNSPLQTTELQDDPYILYVEFIAE